jgi:homoserine O-acetyltransferase
MLFQANFFSIHNFQLSNGSTLPEVQIAYETYGKPNNALTNVVLLTHGYTSSHHMGQGSGAGLAEGVWSSLIGPDKAIDTNIFFAISSNMLGSSYGSTSPADINPISSDFYGPDFPQLSMIDIVNAQKLLIEHLGIHRLVAVVGPSYGGFQAFQWAVSFPDSVIGIVPVTSNYKTAPRATEDLALVRSKLESDPNWNNGRYYHSGGVNKTMEHIRFDTLTRYGMHDVLHKDFPDVEVRNHMIAQFSSQWAKEFDANSLLALGEAMADFNLTNQLHLIKAQVLLVLARTDLLFPPEIAIETISRLTTVGVSCDYYEIDTEYGHSSSGMDAAKWSGRLSQFLQVCWAIAQQDRA